MKEIKAKESKNPPTHRSIFPFVHHPSVHPNTIKPCTHAGTHAYARAHRSRWCSACPPLSGKHQSWSWATSSLISLANQFPWKLHINNAGRTASWNMFNLGNAKQQHTFQYTSSNPPRGPQLHNVQLLWEQQVSAIIGLMFTRVSYLKTILSPWPPFSWIHGTS